MEVEALICPELLNYMKLEKIIQQPLDELLKKFGILKTHYVVGNHVKVVHKNNYPPR